jgi:hypothetical protein
VILTLARFGSLGLGSFPNYHCGGVPSPWWLQMSKQISLKIYQRIYLLKVITPGHHFHPINLKECGRSSFFWGIHSRLKHKRYSADKIEGLGPSNFSSWLVLKVSGGGDNAAKSE